MPLYRSGLFFHNLWDTCVRVRAARRRPEDYVSNRNISNIFEEVPVLAKFPFIELSIQILLLMVKLLPCYFWVTGEIPCPNRSFSD